MVVGGAAAAPPDVNNIMGGMEHTAPGVRMHNHRRKLRQRFDLVRKLGQGTYGKVQLGINKETGQEVAIKTIKKAKIETEADLIRIRREIQIMSSVRHPNIIHIYEVFENKEKMVLVMEYAAGGELYDYLSQRKVLSETEARRVFRQVASAVYYCHKHKICHRDLKLENILLDENKSAKIADFGLSNVFDERRLLTTFCGSPLYASPEIVRGTPYHGPEVDCWSLGVLLYTLVYGAMPFDGSNFKRLVKQISSGDYYEPADKPSTASTLIRQMLLVDPVKRATVEDICSHWWVNESYGESCLEVAEELANQTPVRLDLLLTILPPVESADTVVVDPKQLVDERKDPAEGDSMNEYLSSKAEENPPPESCIKATEPETIKAASKKNKKESKEEHQNKADAAAAPKRRKAEAITPDDPVVIIKEECIIQPIESPANSVSPIDDSGIQSNITSEHQQQPPILQDPPAEAEVVLLPSSIKDVDMQVDEGFSTEAASSDVPEKIISNPADITDAHPAPAQPSVDISSLNSVDLGQTSPPPPSLIDSSPPPPPEPHSSITSTHPPISPSAGPTESHQENAEIPKNPVEIVPTSPEIQPKNEEVVAVVTRPESAVIRRINAADNQQQQQRQSKILRHAAEMFSNNAITSPPKSTMTLERPKKVIIYDFKLATSDSRRAFEAKALEQHNKAPNVVPVIKVSDAKKAFESSAAAAAASTVAKPERPSGTTNHHSLPRRTLIQTPASSIETVNKPLGLQPGEKVLVGGLGVKIGAVGKVTEIGMKVKTEEPAKKEVPTVLKKPKTPPATKEIQVMLDTGESEPKVASMLVPDNDVDNRPTSPPLLVRPNPPATVIPASKPVKKPSSILPNKKTKEPIQPSPPRLTSPPPQIALMALARALSPPPAATGIMRAFSPPPAAVRALSPPPAALRALSPPPPVAGGETVVAGSENAFIRSIRSPTKESSINTTKVLQKAEISIPVSATSLTTTPRERIIPIRVESREGSQESSRIPQRILSPPPKAVVNRQESVQSPVEEGNKKKSLPPPPNRELIRKSPREFIIPITVEKGDGTMTSTTATSSATNTSSSGTAAAHRNLRKKINDALLSETDTADSLMMNGMSHPASPLQRLSSFKKFYEDHHPTGRARLGSGSSHGDDDDDDDDDDDTFQILTAESLFSTLLSRVRQLTKRSQKMDNNDPLLSSVFRNSRFGSPAPSSSSNRSRTAYEQDPSTVGSPASCASPDPAGSSLISNKPLNNWNNNAYSRASSIASETDARRYSGTPDQSNPASTGAAPWRSREPSILDEKRGTNPEDEFRPFTSSLTRRVLNQHLKETNPELIGINSNIDTLSETSSNRSSSLSKALQRLSSVLGPIEQQNQKSYGRTQSNGELLEASQPRRSFQRYGRANTDGTELIEQQRSPEEASVPTYRTYTRTRSREFLTSPNGSRCTSPLPAVLAPPPNNELQLSIALENGPKLVSPTSPGSSVDDPGSTKSRRISRFLRSDFFENNSKPPTEKMIPVVLKSIHTIGTNPASSVDDPLEPLTRARQNLTHVIPIQRPDSIDQPVVNGEAQKSSPKLGVRRQFEHLINLAAAQFQPKPSNNNAEAISIELKELEDEIKNTAAIKAQAAAKLDALKYQHALKSGMVGLPVKPTIPAKPDFLVSRLPSEFMPFQYNGTNGALRELSQRRDVLSPERSEEAPVRFARIKRTSNIDPPDGLLLDGSSEMVPGTPTDSYESSSVCSDLRGDQRDSGEDESVSERIFRKSFYTRFNNDPQQSSTGVNNNSNHHHHHRRSVTSKELLADAPSSVTDRSSHRRSMHRPSHHRDESAEAVMVRKFLSSAASEPVNPSFERERRLSRHRPLDGHTDGSREPSMARSIKGEPSDSSSIASGSSSVTRREPYTRSYTSRTTSSDSGDHRRSFYSNPDHHMSSLPRLNHRSNRYSIQEHPLPSSSGRTNSNINPSSRYSSIFEESSMTKDAGIHGILSPTSSRRHPNLSEAVARRESTFYGGSTNRNGNSNGSSYYSRSTSTGLDSSSATGTGGGNNNVSAYATMRPSYSRHRR